MFARITILSLVSLLSLTAAADGEYRCKIDAGRELCPFDELTGKMLDYPAGFKYSKADQVGQVIGGGRPTLVEGNITYLPPYEIAGIKSIWGSGESHYIKFQNSIGPVPFISVGDLSREWSYSPQSGIFSVGVMDSKVSKNFFRAFQMKSFRVFPRAKGPFKFSRNDNGDVVAKAPNNMTLSLKMIRNGDFKLTHISGVEIPDAPISHQDITGFDPKILKRLILIEDIGQKAANEGEVDFDLPGYLQRFATFTDRNGKSCRIQNSKIYVPLNDNNDVVDTLKFETDGQLSTFLRGECPQLNLVDLN